MIKGFSAARHCHSVQCSMAFGLNLLRALTLLALHLLLPDGLAQEDSFNDQKPEEKRVFDYFYKDQKMKSDMKSLPFRRFIQLYSRNSGRHVRIKADRSVDAIGEDGDKYAKLVIESVSFGRVRIRGSATNFYLCVDKRGRLRARARGKWKDNCFFTDRVAENAYTEFSSVKYNDSLVAFTRKGRPRQVLKTEQAGGVKAVQFIERASNIRLYRARKYKINRGKGGTTIELYRKTQPSEKITVSFKTWKEFKRWRKLRKRIDTSRTNSSRTTASPINITSVQLSSTPTKAVKIL